MCSIVRLHATGIEMKKIAIISTSYYPNIWNGQGRSTYNTAYGLSKKGYDVTVFTFTNKSTYITNTVQVTKQQKGQITIYYIGNVSTEEVSTLPFSSLGVWNDEILKMLNQQNYEAIILNNWHGYEAAKSYGKAKIISIIPFLYNFSGWLKPLAVEGLEDEIKKREVECLLGSDVLVAHTEKFARKISTYTDKEVVILPNCHLDTSAFKPLAYDPVPNRLCYVGRINREKNLERIIRVLPEVPSAEFHIASPESKLGHFTKLQELAKANDVEHRVKFLGWLPTQKVKELYASSALAIVSSQFEPYGYPALDPMALGTPVLVSEWSCLQEYLGTSDMVFSSLNALQEKISLALGVPADVLLANAKENKERTQTILSEEYITSQLETLL
jgi:alpha-maltose-1-phosphate synthase